MAQIPELSDGGGVLVNPMEAVPIDSMAAAELGTSKVELAAKIEQAMLLLRQNGYTVIEKAREEKEVALCIAKHMAARLGERVYQVAAGTLNLSSKECLLLMSLLYCPISASWRISSTPQR